MRTPARNPLHLPTRSLALAIAAEWDMQTDERRGIEPVTMPLMSLASTAIDQVQYDRETAIATCMKYLPTDAALFFTNETDRVLLAKQRKHLSPVIRWVSRQLRVDIQTTTEMAGRIKHPEETVNAFRTMLEKMVSLQHYMFSKQSNLDDIIVFRTTLLWLVCKVLYQSVSP